MASPGETLPLTAVPPPLVQWEDGSIRIAGTRMRFNIIITAYKLGKTPEQLTQSFPDLSLEKAYALIAYYLAHRPEVDAWLEQIDREAREAASRYEARWPNTEAKERIKARWAEMRASDPH